MTPAQPPLIDTPEGLSELVDRCMQEKAVALDTEFHGEKRYWPDLYLVQVSSAGISPVAVDPLAVPDLSDLGRLLENPDVVKIIHSARNDIGVLLHHIPGISIRNVFDTQIAAAFLGYGEQMSLANLVKSVCRAKPPKQYSMSDWSVRPLSPDQVLYALDDVRYLPDIYERLSTQLERKGRMQWFLDESADLTDPESYLSSPEDQFRRTRSADKVKPQHHHLLWMLVNWREELARSMNRPRQFIAQDSLLCRIAILAPSTVEDLSLLRGLPGGFTEKYGTEIVRLSTECSQDPPKNTPRIEPPDQDWGRSARKDILRIFLKKKSAELKISPTVLLPKETMERLLDDPPASVGDLQGMAGVPGWRKDALGEELVDLFNGRLGLVLSRNRGIRMVRIR